jgi:hypothetical protein
MGLTRWVRLGIASSMVVGIAAACVPSPIYATTIGDFTLKSEQVSGNTAQWNISGRWVGSTTVTVDFGLVGRPPNTQLVGDPSLIQQGAFGPTGNGVISTTNVCVTARGTDDGPWIRCGTTHTWTAPPGGGQVAGSIAWGAWKSFGGVCYSDVAVPKDLGPFNDAYVACVSPFAVVAIQSFSVNFSSEYVSGSGNWISLGGSPLSIGTHTYSRPNLVQIYGNGVWTDRIIQTFTDNQQWYRTPSTNWAVYHQ